MPRWELVIAQLAVGVGTGVQEAVVAVVDVERQVCDRLAITVEVEQRERDEVAQARLVELRGKRWQRLWLVGGGRPRLDHPGGQLGGGLVELEGPQSWWQGRAFSGQRAASRAVAGVAGAYRPQSAQCQSSARRGGGLVEQAAKLEGRQQTRAQWRTHSIIGDQVAASSEREAEFEHSPSIRSRGNRVDTTGRSLPRSARSRLSLQTNGARQTIVMP